MSSLPHSDPLVPPDRYPPLPLLCYRDVRIDVLTPHGRTRKSCFVRICTTAGDPEVLAFSRAIREYRALHGNVLEIVAIDLAPGF